MEVQKRTYTPAMLTELREVTGNNAIQRENIKDWSMTQEVQGEKVAYLPYHCVYMAYTES